MLLIPDLAIPLWPWKLSALTSQAIGAWGVGIGILVIQASWENDWWRLFPFMASYALYGVLQAINLVRYPATLVWSRFSAVAYTAFVVSVLLTGGYGAWQALRMRRSRQDGHHQRTVSLP